MQAFTVSMGQGGGFYMNTEDRSKAHRLLDFQVHGDEGNFRPTSAFGHARNLTSDSENDYFSMSSLSSSSSDSALSSQWKHDSMLSGHHKEHSGYGLSGPTTARYTSRIDDASDPYTRIIHSRNRDRPALRLQDEAILRSSNISSDENGLALSADSKYSGYNDNNIAPYTAASELQGNLTPRIGAFWQSEDHALPQSLYDVQRGRQTGYQNFAPLVSTAGRRMPTFPGEESYYGTSQASERMLRHSYSVSPLLLLKKKR